MAILVPTLSSNGWVKDTALKADSLFAYYLISNASQSYLYTGLVSSLPNDIAISNNDTITLTDVIKKNISALFSRYFQAVEVIVKVSAIDPLKPNELNIDITVEVTDNNERFTLGKLIETVDSKVKQVTDLM